MRKMLETILRDYASECIVETADGRKTVRAFIQPIASRSTGDFLRQMHALGQIPEGRYLYIGPVAATPVQDKSVFSNGREYSVCKAETFVIKNEPVYIWALLRECGGQGDAESY